MSNSHIGPRFDETDVLYQKLLRVKYLTVKFSVSIKCDNMYCHGVIRVEIFHIETIFDVLNTRMK